MALTSNSNIDVDFFINNNELPLILKNINMIVNFDDNNFLNISLLCSMKDLAITTRLKNALNEINEKSQKVLDSFNISILKNNKNVYTGNPILISISEEDESNPVLNFVFQKN